MRDDSSLVAAFKAGDKAAFEELYERHFGAVFGAVYMRTHHKQTAEEIVSQAWLQALERIHTFKPGKGSFGGWLHRIARNLVIDYYRSLRPNDSIEDVWDLPGNTDVPRDADTALRVESVRQQLAGLPPKQRDIVLLRGWYGYPFAEIADMTGMTEAACKMSYKRSLEQLRSLFIVLLFFSSVFHVLT